jgi:hypothetical protein
MNVVLEVPLTLSELELTWRTFSFKSEDKWGFYRLLEEELVYFSNLIFLDALPIRTWCAFTCFLSLEHFSSSLKKKWGNYCLQKKLVYWYLFILCAPLTCWLVSFPDQFLSISTPCCSAIRTCFITMTWVMILSDHIFPLKCSWYPVPEHNIELLIVRVRIVSFPRQFVFGPSKLYALPFSDCWRYLYRLSHFDQKMPSWTYCHCSHFCKTILWWFADGTLLQKTVKYNKCRVAAHEREHCSVRTITLSCDAFFTFDINIHVSTHSWMKVAECSPTDKYLRIQINETIDFRFYYCFFHSFFSLVLFASGGVCFYLKTTDFARLCLPMTTDMFRFATTKHMNLDGEV